LKEQRFMMRKTGTRRRAARWMAIAAIFLFCVIPILSMSNVLAQEATPDTDKPAPSAQDLIAEALDSHQLDYGTSLVYRAYALFGDPRLPEAYYGSGSIGEDRQFFGEVKTFWDDLPLETRNQLTPFVVRPNDTRSIFYEPGGNAMNPGAAAAPDAQPAFADGDCQDGWVAKGGDDHPFKVWMHCDGNYEEDLDSAIKMIEVFWDKELALMGAPIFDTGSEAQGGDERIDFYFVDSESDPTPRPGVIGIPESAMAYASADEPVVGTGSSSFVVGRRLTIGEPFLALTLAHEFLHVLQYAHNWQIGFGFKGTPYSDDFDVLTFAEQWFVEASADWMKSYIYRDIFDAQIMQNYLWYRFTSFFQGADLPLTWTTHQESEASIHIYAASVYFLFMEQELGPEAIAEFWKEIEPVAVDDFDTPTMILNEILPFDEHFRDFTVRNLNLDLDGDPISPLYEDIDSTFPTNTAPPLNFKKGENGRLKPEDEPRVYNDTIPNLSAHYFYFTPSASVEQLTFDFSGLLPNDSVDVDLIVQLDGGTWERRQYDPAEPINFCRSIDDENVTAIYAVVTNHAMFDTETVRGSFTASASDESCS
jgi:hypothetical protein